jgi:hypothetical protein
MGDADGLICGCARVSAVASALPDPIFASIERYEKAYEQHGEAIGAVEQYQEAHRSALGFLPDSEDHPMLKELEGRLSRAGDAAHEAACNMVLTVPTTRAGVQALRPLFDSGSR